MENPPSFRRMLKDYRKARDLTQEQLAEQVSCSVETIKKIEAGKLRPGRQLAELLADCLTAAPEDREVFMKAARVELNLVLPASPNPHAALVPTASDPPPVLPPVRMPPSPLANSNRRMLTKVKTFWVEGVLEHSLHGAALLALGLQAKADAVSHPWDTIVQQPNYPARLIPSGTRIIEVFDELDGEMLILGSPGAGKTTLLLELARDLLVRAEVVDAYPMPVVFNLSSWAVRRPPFLQ
jgi:transcriptional regulator with XRE-family HTH domain